MIQVNPSDSSDNSKDYSFKGCTRSPQTNPIEFIIEDQKDLIQILESQLKIEENRVALLEAQLENEVERVKLKDMVIGHLKDSVTFHRCLWFTIVIMALLLIFSPSTKIAHLWGFPTPQDTSINDNK